MIAVGAFGELEAQPELRAKRVKEVDGGLWVGQQDDSPSFCSQQLVFPDGVTVQVQGSVYEGDVDTCPMAEAGMDQLITAVQDGDVEHRSPERGRPGVGDQPVCRRRVGVVLRGGDGAPPVHGGVRGR